jgi:glutathione S-transferase
MATTLYFSPGTCAFVPHALLEIADAQFDTVLVKLHKGEHNKPDFMALNPRGQVPVLVMNSFVLTQLLAIVLYLDTQFPQASLLPHDPRQRAKAMETLAWMNNTVHPTFSHIFLPHKFASDEATQSQIKAHALRQYRSQLQELEATVELSERQGYAWLAGEHVGPLDAYALTLLRWGTLAQMDPEDFPVLWKFVQRVATHPKIARALARERLQISVFK